MTQESSHICLECGNANRSGRIQCGARGAWVPQTAKARGLAHQAQSAALPSPLTEQESAGPPTRPTGVTVLAVLDFVGAGFAALAALATSFFIEGDYGGMSVLYLLFAVGYGLLGWGMWTLREWARALHIMCL